MVPPTRYRDAGVDIDAGDEAVRRIKRVVRSTFGPHVVSEIGSFAGASTVPGADPDILLLASMDGVGTKIKVAARLGRYDTVGRDLVNHCVGDIGVHGADPLFFLDYVGSGRLDPEMVEQIVTGLAAACRENECALIGGETAEMPGIYAPGDFDLVGCIVGTVRREAFVNGSTAVPGDVLLGFPSTGLHTNGYSLARKVLFEIGKLDSASPVPGAGVPLGDALLAVHRSYRPVFRVLRGIACGFAHITGGGIPGNLNRILPEGTAARVDRSRWTVPPIFRLIAETGQVPVDDCYRTFNMGIGLIAVVPAARREEALAQAGPEAVELGEIVAGSGEVRLEGETRW